MTKTHLSVDSSSSSIYYSLTPNNNNVDCTKSSIKSKTGDNCKVRSNNSLSLISLGSESTESFKSISSSETDGIKQSKRRCFEQIEDGLKIDLVKCADNDANSVVLVSIQTDSEMDPNFSTSQVSLKRPIYQFKSSVNWNNASRIIQSEIKQHGIYLAGIWWKLRDKYTFAYDDRELDKGEVCVLHCITKEPENKFRGRIGPISTFVPRNQSDNKKISGIWVSLLQDKILSNYINPLLFFNESYRCKLRAIDANVNQMLFFVSNEAACVGIQIMNTKKEEKQIRRNKVVLHHERPLVLEDGFILVEGIFKANYINTSRTNTYGDNNINRYNTKQFDTSNGAKIVIIGEGIHLIRTVTENINSSNVTSLLGSPVPTVSSPVAFQPFSTITKTNKKGKKKNRANNNNNNIVQQPSTSQRQSQLKSSTNKENPVQEDNTKIRTVEVCLDSRYQTQIITVDYNQIKHDLNFE